MLDGWRHEMALAEQAGYISLAPLMRDMPGEADQ
jgi:hypothetical protein